jgi:hypothetical protein
MVCNLTVRTYPGGVKLSPFSLAVLSSLALSSFGTGAVVYEDIADFTIPQSFQFIYGIDFNGDAPTRAGSVDITGPIAGYDLFIGNLDASLASVTAPDGGVYSHTGDYASRVGPNTFLNPISLANSSTWVGGDNALKNGPEGHWAGTSGTAFIGVTFNPNPGNPDAPFETYHHGWVRVYFDDASNTITVLDFAYETTPGVGITTIPEPSAALLSLIGCTGFFFLRRHRSR